MTGQPSCPVPRGGDGGNAASLPGDAEWLADLLRHGLLTGSFVPDRPQRELRELTRYRTSLVRERATAINRIQKTLEGCCGYQLHPAVSQHAHL